MHTILFTGHMIDRQDRKVPRFPAHKEQSVKKEIERFLTKEKESNKNLRGIAGGACGGDIIFHEVCEELHIVTEIYLALPPEEFKKQSVSFAGKDWEQRFDKIIQTTPFYVLSDAAAGSEPDIWEGTNIWMLDAALTNGGDKMTLIALWDGLPGDNGGGTEHMVTVAREQNARIKIIDINKL